MSKPSGIAIRALAALRAVVLLLGCQPAAAPDPRPLALHALQPAPRPETLQRLLDYGFNAFVVPLLDDGEIPRWVDPRQPLLCGEDADVQVDGRPLEPGTEVPPGAFTLQWNLRLHCPFGVDGPALDGTVEVAVYRTDEHGMEAVLVPRDLTVSDEDGAVQWRVGAPPIVVTQWSEPARMSPQAP